MSHAHVVVELLPQDTSAPKLLYGLERALHDAPINLSCSIERKDMFEAGKDLEHGAALAINGALVIDRPWCVYIAPRKLVIVVNGKASSFINGTFIAIARHRYLAALFLHTFTIGDDLPDFVAMALSDRVDAARHAAGLRALSEKDEQTAELLRKAIENAYINAFTGAHLN